MTDQATDQAAEMDVHEAGAVAEIPASSVIARYNPAIDDWDALAGQAHTILGYDLAKDELADELAGVDFLVTRATYRPGIVRKVDGEKKQFAYVSAEAVIAPGLNIKKVNIGRKASDLEPVADVSELPFGPGDHIVVNDGSTGIYRQITQYLASTGLIRLPDGAEGGEMGESKYDLPPADWTDAPGAEDFRYNSDGFAIADFNIRLRCPRGLRLSRYTNEYTNGEEATTRYLG